jgi:hypothetical protein
LTGVEAGRCQQRLDQLAARERRGWEVVNLACRDELFAPQLPQDLGQSLAKLVAHRLGELSLCRRGAPKANAEHASEVENPPLRKRPEGSRQSWSDRHHCSPPPGHS